MSRTIHRARTQRTPAAIAVLTAALVAAAPTPLRAGTTGTSALITQQGSAAALANGDFVARNGGGLNTMYRYFVEVPASASLLRVQIFDADVGLGGTGEAIPANRDRQRSGAWDTSAVYRLVNPSGTTVATLTGDAAGPAGSDNAWISLFDSSARFVLDQFGAVSYANNNGNQNWATSWIETGDDNLPGSGLITVAGGSLSITDNGVAPLSAIEREANLSGASSATLSFDFTTANINAGRQIVVEAATSGAGPFTVLETFTAPVANGARTYNLTPFISATTRVRFRNLSLTGNDTFSPDNVRIDFVVSGAGTVAAGHWEVQIDMSSAVTGGDDINALGLRADDGDATSGGTELNLYYDSFLATGTNDVSIAARTYTVYPWLVSGCSCSSNNFDADTLGSVTTQSRTGTFSAPSTLSGNGVWTPTTITGWTDNDDSIDYGLWTMTHVAATSAANGGNYYTHYMTNQSGAAPPPTANPQANALRTYFPTDGAVKPAKPYLEQTLRARAGFNNPPLLGVPSRYNVTIRLVNPSTLPVVFSLAANVVTANVPAAAGGGTTTYRGGATPTQGTVTSQPAIGGTGNVVWNPGTLAAGATAFLTYEVEITPTVAATNVNATGTFTSGNGTRAQYVDETGNTTQARATVTLGGLCEVFTSTAITTPATVAPLRAERMRHGLLLTWETAAEDSVAGFLVERQDGLDGWTPVHDGLLFATNAAPGATYRLRDDVAPADGATYRIIEVGAAGERRVHGPYLVTPQPAGRGTVPPAGAFESSLRSASPVVTDDAPASAPLAFQTAAAGLAAADQEARVRTTAEGLHRLSVEGLASALGTTADDVRNRLASAQIELTNRGIPVAWRAEPDGSGLVFWADRTGSLYTNENVFTVRRVKGRTMPAEPSSTGRSVFLPSFLEERVVETDAFSATGLPLPAESDWWFWDFLVLGNPTFGSRSFTFDAPGLARGGAQLEVRLQGATSTGVAEEHQVAVRLNGEPLGDTRFAAIAANVTRFDVPSVREIGNVVELETVPVPGVPYSTSYVDGFTVRYQRLFRAVDDALLFRSPGGTITVSGFSRSDIGVYRVGSPYLTSRLDGVTVTGGPASWSATFTAPAGRFAVVASSAVVEGVVTAFTPGPSLTAPHIRADWLAIVPASLKNGADRLAALRRAQGLRTFVATFEDVVDQFSSGLVTPEAIRAFLSHATTKWLAKPRYVVLVGAGHFDYLSHLGPRPNLLPPLMRTGTVGIYPSDNALADRHLDGLPDAAIGRIPVTTRAELTAWIDKLERYESGVGSDLAVVLSDNAEGGADFLLEADRVVAPIPETFAKVPVSLDTATLSTARQQLFDAWGRAALVSYVGHGGIDRLASEGLLTNADATALPGSLPLLSALTCYVNRFGIPGFTSLGEALLRQPSGGAIAVWSSSAASENLEATQAGVHLSRLAWAAKAPRLGDAIQGALTTFASLGGPPAATFFLGLLGDPAMLLKHPAPPQTPGGSGE